MYPGTIVFLTKTCGSIHRPYLVKGVAGRVIAEHPNQLFEVRFDGSTDTDLCSLGSISEAKPQTSSVKPARSVKSVLSSLDAEYESLAKRFGQPLPV